MKKYSLLVLLIVGAIACNKNISKDISSNKTITDIQTSDKDDIMRDRYNNRNSEVLDPNYFPPPVIQTFEELDDWLEFNDNLVLAHFAPGSSKPFFTLDEGLLQRLAEHINEKEKSTFKLIGHTNNQGDAEENMRLSKQRSWAVLDAMMNSYGLRFNKMGANGEGETNPLNDNSTLEMRKANSRVELRKLK